MKHFISSLSVLCANTPPCEGRVSSRKILSLLLILFLGVTNAWAETASITFSEKGLTNGVQYLEPFTIDANTTITFAGGDNDGKYYTTGSGMRTYNQRRQQPASQQSYIPQHGRRYRDLHTYGQDRSPRQKG